MEFRLLIEVFSLLHLYECSITNLMSPLLLDIEFVYFHSFKNERNHSTKEYCDKYPGRQTPMHIILSLCTLLLINF